MPLVVSTGPILYIKKREKMYRFNVFIGFAILLFIVGCGAPGQEGRDTFTTGEVNITADATLEPYVSTSIFNFVNLNQGSDINALYLPEVLAFEALKADSVKAIIACRQLNNNEEAYFSRLKVVPRYTRLGTDAIAFLVNKNNPDSLLTINTIRNIFSGDYKNWSAINAERSNIPLSVVFDHAGSSSVSALKATFDLDDIPDNMYAVETNIEVVDYVSKNIGAIGVLGNNWINNLNRVDLDDFNSKVQIALISSKNDDDFFVRPEQTYIGDSTYYFTRTIWAINCESRSGLASGLISFMATDRGQRIMLKSGLLPEWMPPREILIHTDEE